MASPAELAAMRRAIALSAAGLGTTSPNPPVGCVLLDPAGRITGEGYHERKGGPHAEAQALAAAGPLADGGTAVVTLEPCNHQGRTPPCRQALIDAGIRRAVVAVIDPTSRGEGGVAVMRQAGIDVETGVLAGEARIVLGRWLAGLENRRPVITWPYLITGHGVEPVPRDLSEARDLGLNADAVLRADGTVREAVPGSHGAGILTLKDQPPGTSAAEAAVALYEAGVRHLLLDGNHDAAGPFLAADLVDRVAAFMPHGGASGRPEAGLPWPLLPPGFVITGAVRTDDFIRVDGQPGALRWRCAYQACDALPGPGLAGHRLARRYRFQRHDQLAAPSGLRERTQIPRGRRGGSLGSSRFRRSRITWVSRRRRLPAYLSWPAEISEDRDHPAHRAAGAVFHSHESLSSQPPMGGRIGPAGRPRGNTGTLQARASASVPVPFP